MKIQSTQLDARSSWKKEFSKLLRLDLRSNRIYIYIAGELAVVWIYIVYPDESMNGRIGADVAFEVDVTSFANLFGRHSTTQFYARPRWIYFNPIDY